MHFINTYLLANTNKKSQKGEPFQYQVLPFCDFCNSSEENIFKNQPHSSLIMPSFLLQSYVNLTMKHFFIIPLHYNLICSSC